MAETNAALRKDPRYAALRWMEEGAMLHDPSIQLIVVECRVWEALAWGKKVIDAGKHLHLEKPTGNEWKPFKDLVEEARRKKLILQSGYLWRWHQGLMAAIEAATRPPRHSPRLPHSILRIAGRTHVLQIPSVTESRPGFQPKALPIR